MDFKRILFVFFIFSVFTVFLNINTVSASNLYRDGHVFPEKKDPN